MEITKKQLVRYIDHTLLKPQSTLEEVKQVCAFAREHNCASACINPFYIPVAKEILQGSNTKLCVVIGFPLGASTTSIKAKETEDAYNRGAEEIDMVLNIGALKSGQYSIVREDIKEVVNASPAIVKVIIETCYLTDEEKIIACRLSQEAGAHFVKTSTGFGPKGATVEDIKIMKETIGNTMKIKAAGGIGDLNFALQLIEAGCDRLGMSRTKSILEEMNT